MRKLCALALVLAGCSATISGDRDRPGPDDGTGGDSTPRRPGTGDSPAPPGGSAPAPVTGGAAAVAQGAAVMPLRRLTRREYDNTIRDLLDDASRPASAFPREPSGETGFALAATVSPLDAQFAAEAAERVASGAVKNLPRLLGCDPARGEAACVKSFVETFGKRAYRRPLEADEVADLQKLYAEARTLGFDLATGVGAVVQAMLQSPSFLYRWEVGAARPVREGALVKLGPYQVASRLSYLFWGTMPDAALFAAADRNELGTPEQVAAQARRLLAVRERVAETLSDFHAQWLHADGVADLVKDRKAYPDWNPALAAAMSAELTAYVNAAVVDGDGRLDTLFTAGSTFVNAALSKVYGMTGVTGDALKAAPLDPAQRAGLLTLAGVLAANGGADGSNPVRRGQTVYRQVLCGEVANPPADIPEPKPASPNLSTRERFAEHASNACAGCHRLFDPLGFAFEHYDGIGRYRTTDGGKPVDASGQVTLPGGAELRFASALALAPQLAASDDARSCYARQWMRYALGRRDEAGDAGSLAAVQQQFAKASFGVRDLLLAMVQTKAFLYRAPAPGEVP